MAVREFVIIIAFASLVNSNEVDDVEQKKRGVEKATSLNTIPTGAQKDYSYNIYSQSTSHQNSAPNQSYQNQVPNSFYPNQASSQYYSSGSSSPDTSTSYSPQAQVNVIPSQTSSQFVPLNFMPNPGYQSKYQVVSSKPGNIQLAFLQPNYPQSQIVPYPQIPQTYFSQPPTNQVNSNQSPYNAAPQFSISPQFQPVSGPYLGQPTTMMVLAQPNNPLYNNLVYSNPAQSFYNYYPSNSQPKYSISYSSPPQSGYEKVQGTFTQNSPKEDNDIGTHNAEYAEQSDPNSTYKNAYTSRSTYAKLQ